MSDEIRKTQYFIVNERPVKLVPTTEGGLDVRVYNYETKSFERNMSYYAYCFSPDKEVDELSVAQFEAYVADLRAELEE